MQVQIETATSTLTVSGDRRERYVAEPVIPASLRVKTRDVDVEIMLSSTELNDLYDALGLFR